MAVDGGLHHVFNPSTPLMIVFWGYKHVKALMFFRWVPLSPEAVLPWCFVCILCSPKHVGKRDRWVDSKLWLLWGLLRTSAHLWLHPEDPRSFVFYWWVLAEALLLHCCVHKVLPKLAGSDMHARDPNPWCFARLHPDSHSSC